MNECEIKVGDKVAFNCGLTVGTVITIYISSRDVAQAEILLNDGRVHCELVERLVKVGE